jgi:hypothetical protein
MESQSKWVSDYFMSESKPITFYSGGTAALMADAPAPSHDGNLRLSPLASDVKQHLRTELQSEVSDWKTALDVLEAFAQMADTLDDTEGLNKAVQLHGSADAVAGCLAEIARLELFAHSRKLGAQTSSLPAAIDRTAVAVAIWCMRHDVDLRAPAPVINALARLSNAAASTEERVAIFALMERLAAHLAPQLGADLEQSNPERPWRMLHLNLAITAIRTGDPTAIRHAFSLLNHALPLDRLGFYESAAQNARAKDFPSEVRALIELELDALADSKVAVH